MNRYRPQTGWDGEVALSDDGVVSQDQWIDQFYSNSDLYFDVNGKLRAAMIEYHVEVGGCHGQIISVANFDAIGGAVRKIVDLPDYARYGAFALGPDGEATFIAGIANCYTPPTPNMRLVAYDVTALSKVRGEKVVASELNYASTPPVLYASQDASGGVSALWGTTDGIQHAIFTRIADAPIADAGENQDYYVSDLAGAAVTLDGSASHDISGDLAAYRWSQVEGDPVTLSGENSAVATFVPPSLALGESADLVFALEVSDAAGMISRDTVSVELHGANIAPVMHVEGSYSDWVVPKGKKIIMGNGDWLTDADGHVGPGYEWRQYRSGKVRWLQLSGPPLEFTRNNTLVGEFVTPLVEVDSLVSFEMRYTDHAGDSVSEVFSFTVLANYPPQARATYQQTGNEIELRGSGSSDVDGQIVSYQWVQTSGPTVSLVDPTAANTTFVSPGVDATLTFELTVTDDGGKTGTDIVNVPVTDSGPPTTTSTVATSTSKGNTYYEVTLASNEPGNTYYRISGDGSIVGGGLNTVEWQVYGISVTYEIKSGTATLYYYSIDAAGNQEAIQMEVLQ